MHTPVLVLSIYLSALFSPEMVVLMCVFLLTVAVSLILLRRIKFKNIFKQHVSNGIKASLLIVGSTVISVVVVHILKHMFAVPRPITMLVEETGYRFPSGHAAVSSAFLCMIVVCTYAIYTAWPKSLRYLVSSICIILLIGVCASRLVLQVHKPIDIFVGILVGLLSVSIMFYIYKRLSYDETTSNKNLG